MAEQKKRTRAKRAPGGSLREYNRKRNFSVSPEPTGAKAKKKPAKKKGPIFCVQKHLASHLHYDFRLEHDGVLVSWAVPKGPSLNPADKRLAMKVEDHPFDYADFEGVIPEGYGAGVVMVWDKGTWRPEAGFEDVDKALAKGELKFTLDGVKLKGSWVLVRTRAADGRGWLLIKHRDEWAGDLDVTKAAPLSVKSFGDFADIMAAEKPAVWAPHKEGRGIFEPRGGEAGRMLREVIAKAAEIKEARGKRPAGRKKATRSTAKR